MDACYSEFWVKLSLCGDLGGMSYASDVVFYGKYSEYGCFVCWMWWGCVFREEDLVPFKGMV